MTGTQLVLTESRALPLFDPVAVAADSNLIASFKKNNIGHTAVRGVRRLLPSACTSVDLAVVSALASVLNIDAAKALRAGWNMHYKVKDAITLTAVTPGLEKVVTICEHRICSTYHPTVKVFVDEVEVHTYAFDLNVTFTIEGVAVTLKEGRVTNVRSGRCQVDATLKSLGLTLKEWTFELVSGLELTTDDAAPGAPQQAGGHHSSGDDQLPKQRQ
jgi:hypothetical protein